MQTVGSTRLDVVPAALGRWDVREPGSRHALVSTSSEAEALRRARRMMKRRGGEIRLYDVAGAVATTDAVIGLDHFPRPWWAVSTSPWSIILGALFFLAGLVGLFAGTAAWWSWVQLVLGIMYLACFYFSWRWEHHKINGSK